MQKVKLERRPVGSLQVGDRFVGPGSYIRTVLVAPVSDGRRVRLTVDHSFDGSREVSHPINDTVEVVV